MTYLCVPIPVLSAEQARRDIALAAEWGADLVELRIDAFDGWSDPSVEPEDAKLADLMAIDDVLEHCIIPCIVTCRPATEGGSWEGSETRRLALLKAIAASGAAAYVDLEWSSHEAQAAFSQTIHDDTRLILSSHSFEGRPDRLYNLLSEMSAAGAEVIKIAWMARSLRDNIEAFEILEHRSTRTIAICMGEAGTVSRILAKKFNAFLTFASLRDSSATAPGQVTIQQLKDLYRWDAIKPSTRVYGVVAHPVGHSMSPAIHNAAMQATGFDGVYLPLLVQPGYESFKAFMESFVPFEPLDLSGLSITLPHKENALRYLKEKGGEIEELADRIGAVNTILIGRSGPRINLRGLNTDYAAILDSLTATLNIDRPALAKYRVAVLGAGGTGRTAVAALAHLGASVAVFNRTPERAAALASEFNGHAGKVTATPWDQIASSDCQIFINTTSVGMSPNADAIPWGSHPPKLTADHVVFDTIYNPMETRLLKEAKAAGAKTIGGVEMFVRQAAAQFEAWTGTAAPIEIMRKVVEGRLGS